MSELTFVNELGLERKASSDSRDWMSLERRTGIEAMGRYSECPIFSFEEISMRACPLEYDLILSSLEGGVRDVL